MQDASCNAEVGCGAQPDLLDHLLNPREEKGLINSV